jgi:predicted phage terminase large subunit-like protein
MRDDQIALKGRLLGSLLRFTQLFYKLRTGRDFLISEPISRESHHISIARAFTNVFDGKIERLAINIPPRYAKTEMAIHFAAWGLAHYPDCNFLYVSYSHTLAKKQTQTIRDIISMPDYRRYFGVQISGQTSAKDNFETTAGGSVYAVGSEGMITGRGAGIKNCNRFSGAIIIDDIHNITNISSDTIRTAENEWFNNTLQSRVNGPTVPIIVIGQRGHEDDIFGNIFSGNFDKRDWKDLIIPAIDVAGNALDPAMHSKEMLLDMQEKMPYVFASQYQQDPQPAGGGIFKEDWFVLMDEEPEILKTFIVVDGAESLKTYADKTVFSFFGIYRIKVREVDTGLYGIHWLDCWEHQVEPKDLESTFLQFWADCMQHPKKPQMAAIEKKSSGTTLISVLKNVQGLQVIEMDRTIASGSKTARFLATQPYVASKQVSLPRYGKHTHQCIEHMRKITANETHRHDDIADTLADGVKLALIDKTICNNDAQEKTSHVLKTLSQQFNHRKKLRENALWPSR